MTTSKYTKEFLELLPPKLKSAEEVVAEIVTPPEPAPVKTPKKRYPLIPHFEVDARIVRHDVEVRPDHYSAEQVACLKRVEAGETISEREAIDIMLALYRPSELRRAVESIQARAAKPKEESSPESVGSFEKQDFGDTIIIA